MWVVKLGGSLDDNPVLQDWLDALAHYGKGRTVIVPGGGMFADAVRNAQRRWHFGDVAAHHMAILAMQQMALMFHALNAELFLADGAAEIEAALRQGKVALWLPDYRYVDSIGIERSWRVTSDSLAAWLAGRLQARALVLVKSATIPDHVGFRQLAARGLVDAAFPYYARRMVCPVRLVHREDLQGFMNYWKNSG